MNGRNSIDFRAERTGKTTDLYLYDAIGPDAISARTLAAALAGAADVSLIRLYINSPGGSVFDAVAIYNQLVRHPALVEVYIDGIAASAASVVAMAGDSISIASNGMMMLHNPLALTLGNAGDHRKTATTLDAIRDTIAATYATRAAQSIDRATAWMDEETWFAADEAIDAGLADRKTEAKQVTALFDLTAFGAVPKPVSARFGNPHAESVMRIAAGLLDMAPPPRTARETWLASELDNQDSIRTTAAPAISGPVPDGPAEPENPADWLASGFDSEDPLRGGPID